MHKIFRFRNNRRYNLRSQKTSEFPLRNSFYNGTESISSLGPKVLELVPDNQKSIPSLVSFKEQGTKEIAHVGYVNPTFNLLVL